MFSSIRKRLTITNAAMTLAFVFVMSGGAYAASKYIITSTKQIKPSVLKALQGKKGPAGATGPIGLAGAAGLQGPAGEKGTQGTRGATGEKGTQGNTGPTGVTGVTGEGGPAGLPCTASGTLPPGKTESGTWIIKDFAFEGKSQDAAISFPCPLAESITEVHYNETKTTECPGTAAMPEAAIGNLCVYQVFIKGGSGPVPPGGFLSLSGKPGEASPNGVVLVFGTESYPELKGTGEKVGELVAIGTWAVTAK